MTPPMRLLPLAMAALLTAVSAGGAGARVFDAKTFTLANGMQVVLVENHRLPMVTQMVWYKVGAADEPAGQSGLAHLLEHLMFKGTEAVPPAEFSKIVARNGGTDNAFTSSDYTGYYQTIAADRLELVMRLEADRMANLRLDPDIVLTERDVVMEERRSRTDNEPSALLGERMGQALWVVHPYKNPVIGWREEIGKLDRADAIAFYGRWYAPNNAVLVVAGDVTEEALKPLAEKYYGSLPRRDVPERTRNRDLPPPAAVAITMRHADVQQPSWSREYIAPSYQLTNQHPSWPYALQVMAEALGGGATSRLYQSLVVTHKLAASAGASYAPTAVDFGTFRVSASPRPGVTSAAIEQAMDGELAKLAKEGLSAAEVERAKARLRANVVYARDSLSGGARVLGAAVATGQSVEEVEAWPDRIAAVTVADVAEATAAMLTRAPSVTGVLLPEAGGAPRQASARKAATRTSGR